MTNFRQVGGGRPLPIGAEKDWRPGVDWLRHATSTDGWIIESDPVVEPVGPNFTPPPLRIILTMPTPERPITSDNSPPQRGAGVPIWGSQSTPDRGVN